jgi:hypothetical protein
MKRHFPKGHSSRPPKETYRIDHTSVDGSGLQRDDGDQRGEELPPDMADEVAALHPPVKGIR